LAQIAAGAPFQCAFGGINPQIGVAPFLEPVGRSVYNALDIKWQDNVANPFRGVTYLNFQVSYTLSRFENSGTSNALFPAGTPGASDQDFIDNALDNRDPLRYMGPDTLDRKDQLNFGGYARIRGGLQIGITSHFWSPLAVTPLINQAAAPGAIFQSDFSGDGTVGDPLAIAQTSSSCGTAGGQCNYTTYKVGAYGRSLNPAGLTNAIANYNNTLAGKTITPAGQALINAGLVTKADLIALQATPQAVPAPPSGQQGLAWLRAFDFNLSYPVKLMSERLTITPSVSAFNVFNFANFDVPLSIMSGALSGQDGSINGTPPGSVTPRASDRIGTGTGVFGLGAPRAIEWGLKLQF
jgi:hypothetical protein